MTRTTAETHERIKSEIAREKARALGRAGERLEAALEELAALAVAVDAASDPRARAALLREHEAARRRALAMRHDLVIQREALGLRHHAVVEQQFPVPARREERQP